MASRSSFSKHLLRFLSIYLVIIEEGLNVPYLALTKDAGSNWPESEDE